MDQGILIEQRAKLEITLHKSVGLITQLFIRNLLLTYLLFKFNCVNIDNARIEFRNF